MDSAFREFGGDDLNSGCPTKMNFDCAGVEKDCNVILDNCNVAMLQSIKMMLQSAKITARRAQTWIESLVNYIRLVKELGYR